jgi:hypothetical protein
MSKCNDPPPQYMCANRLLGQESGAVTLWGMLSPRRPTAGSTARVHSHAVQALAATLLLFNTGQHPPAGRQAALGG